MAKLIFILFLFLFLLASEDQTCRAVGWKGMYGTL